MDVAPLEESINCTRQVLEAVTAEQLGAPTPCASWAVSDVIEHMIGSQLYFAAAMRGQEPVRSQQPVAADNFLALYDEAAAASLAAFTAPGAGERVLHLPFGDLPGAGAVRLAATDTFVHGWDVAAATGQPTDLAPELAARLLEDARPAVPDALRGPDGQAAFGPEQPAPPRCVERRSPRGLPRPLDLTSASGGDIGPVSGDRAGRGSSGGRPWHTSGRPVGAA